MLTSLAHVSPTIVLGEGRDLQIPDKCIAAHGRRLNPDAGTHRIHREASVSLFVDNDRLHLRMQYIDPLLVSVALANIHALHSRTRITDNASQTSKVTGVPVSNESCVGCQLCQDLGLQSLIQHEISEVRARTYAVWLVEVILLFTVRIKFAGLHQDGEEPIATRGHWVLHISSYSIQVSVEDTWVAPFAEEDQGVCEQFERRGDRGLRFD